MQDWILQRNAGGPKSVSCPLPGRPLVQPHSSPRRQHGPSVARSGRTDKGGCGVFDDSKTTASLRTILLPRSAGQRARTNVRHAIDRWRDGGTSKRDHVALLPRNPAAERRDEQLEREHLAKSTSTEPQFGLGTVRPMTNDDRSMTNGIPIARSGSFAASIHRSQSAFFQPEYSLTLPAS